MPIGLDEATAIIGVVQTGISIATTLTAYVNDVKSAPSTVKKLAIELDFTMGIAEELAKIVQRNGKLQVLTQKGVVTAQKCLYTADEIVRSLVDLIRKSHKNDPLTGHIPEEDVNLTVFSRALWPIFRSQVSTIRQELESLKSNITLLLSLYKVRTSRPGLGSRLAADRALSVAHVFDTNANIRPIENNSPADATDGHKPRRARFNEDPVLPSPPATGIPRRQIDDSTDDESSSESRSSRGSLDDGNSRADRANQLARLRAQLRAEEERKARQVEEMALLRVEAVESYREQLLNDIGEKKQKDKDTRDRLREVFGDDLDSSKIDDFVRQAVAQDVSDELFQFISDATRSSGGVLGRTTAVTAPVIDITPPRRSSLFSWRSAVDQRQQKAAPIQNALEYRAFITLAYRGFEDATEVALPSSFLAYLSKASSAGNSQRSKLLDTTLDVFRELPVDLVSSNIYRLNQKDPHTNREWLLVYARLVDRQHKRRQRLFTGCMHLAGLGTEPIIRRNAGPVLLVYTPRVLDPSAADLNGQGQSPRGNGGPFGPQRPRSPPPAPPSPAYSRPPPSVGPRSRSPSPSPSDLPDGYVKVYERGPRGEDDLGWTGEIALVPPGAEVPKSMAKPKKDRSRIRGNQELWIGPDVDDAFDPTASSYRSTGDPSPPHGSDVRSRDFRRSRESQLIGGFPPPPPPPRSSYNQGSRGYEARDFARSPLDDERYDEIIDAIYDGKYDERVFYEEDRRPPRPPQQLRKQTTESGEHIVNRNQERVIDRSRFEDVPSRRVVYEREVIERPREPNSRSSTLDSDPSSIGRSDQSDFAYRSNTRRPSIERTRRYDDLRSASRQSLARDDRRSASRSRSRAQSRYGTTIYESDESRRERDYRIPGPPSRSNSFQDVRITEQPGPDGAIIITRHYVDRGQARSRSRHTPFRDDRSHIDRSRGDDRARTVTSSAPSVPDDWLRDDYGRGKELVRYTGPRKVVSPPKRPDTNMTDEARDKLTLERLLNEYTLPPTPAPAPDPGPASPTAGGRSAQSTVESTAESEDEAAQDGEERPRAVNGASQTWPPPSAPTSNGGLTASPVPKSDDDSDRI